MKIWNIYNSCTFLFAVLSYASALLFTSKAVTTTTDNVSLQQSEHHVLWTMLPYFAFFKQFFNNLKISFNREPWTLNLTPRHLCHTCGSESQEKAQNLDDYLMISWVGEVVVISSIHQSEVICLTDWHNGPANRMKTETNAETRSCTSSVAPA